MAARDDNRRVKSCKASTAAGSCRIKTINGEMRTCATRSDARKNDPTSFHAQLSQMPSLHATMHDTISCGAPAHPPQPPPLWHAQFPPPPALGHPALPLLLAEDETGTTSRGSAVGAMVGAAAQALEGWARRKMEARSSERTSGTWDTP